MRRVLDEALAFGQRLVHEPELALVEVAQAAVDELRAPAAGARREVVALDERGAQAPAGRVERDTRPGDAAADDEHVEVVVTEPLQRRGPVEPGGRHPRRLPTPCFGVRNSRRGGFLTPKRGCWVRRGRGCGGRRTPGGSAAPIAR